MKTATLGEIGEIFDGPHATPTRQQTGKYFLNISSLKSGRLDLDVSDHVSDEDFKHWTRRVTPRVGDLLFSYETRLGEAALMPAGIDACLGRRMALIRPDKSLIDSRYLLYYWLSPSFQNQISSRAVHGATVSRILLSDLGEWPIRLPERSTQVAIGEVLGALDDKIAANRVAISSGQKLVLAQWERLSASAKENRSLDEVVDLNPRTQLPAEGPHPFLDMKDLPQNGLLVDRWSERESRSGSKFRNGDTLLARITPCFENGKIGLVDFLPPDVTGLGSTEYIVLRPKDGVPQAVPYCIAASDPFRAHAARGMTGTSGRQRVQASNIGDYPVGWPEQDKLDRFGDFTDALTRRLSAARDENSLLARTRDELLPLLMDGRITVKDAEQVVGDVM